MGVLFLAGSLEVKSLKLSCQYSNCSWQGELRELEHHLDKCAYVLTPCPNQCVSGSTFIRRDLFTHLESECPRRKVSCTHCKKEGEYQEITTTHLEECPKLEIKCPNPGCEVSYLSEESLHHKSLCDFELVTCPYLAEFGCKHKDIRKQMKTHKEDYKLHLELITKKVQQLSGKLRWLERKLRPFTFKVSDFQEKKSTDVSAYSKSFLSHTQGYRFIVNVEPNSEGDPYIAVYTYLLKGPNDDSLTWPFTGTVTIELLNQLEDKNHHKMSANFPADDGEVSGRVVDEKVNKGWGHPHFISHDDLEYKSYKNCQYLKDDTLFFRVSVQVPDHKPWLECTS